MSMTAVKTNLIQAMNKIVVDGTVTLSGAYPQHGDTLDLSQLGVPSNAIPGPVWLWSTQTQGAAPQYDTYTFQPGSTQKNGVVQIAVSNTEMANSAAYATTAPSNGTGYVLHFQAEFFPAFI